ncbi:MAG: hypothetical protein J1E06_09290 [Acutalibacter sp.]|nr:hypothetical protein [Acutalibacter sp.]
MDMTIRPMMPQERLYSYSQSQQIMGQTGCIGHHQMDVDTHGIALHGHWNSHCEELRTAEFKAEYETVLNTLRFDEEYGGVLRNRMSLAAYCYSHPDSSFGKHTDEFGFRADTAQYAYLMRLNPNPGESNLYIYCYHRESLDRHLMRAEKGIRFIDPKYKELFRIPDGDQIRITRDDGTMEDRTCRYIDDNHLEVGGELYHICQFAEIMEHNGNKVIPKRSSLPSQCYGVLPGTGEVIIIKKGETGYYKTEINMGDQAQNATLVDEYNQKLGVSKAQAEAMLTGSMFGWHIPAADPKNYDENGKPIRPKNKERGEER